MNISNQVQCEISSVFSTGDREQSCGGERRTRKPGNSRNNDWGQVVTVKMMKLESVGKKTMLAIKGAFEIGNDVREDNFSIVKGSSSYGCEEKELILNVSQK